MYYVIDTSSKYFVYTNLYNFNMQKVFFVNILNFFGDKYLSGRKVWLAQLHLCGF